MGRAYISIDIKCKRGRGSMVEAAITVSTVESAGGALFSALSFGCEGCVGSEGRAQLHQRRRRLSTCAPAPSGDARSISLCGFSARLGQCCLFFPALEHLQKHDDGGEDEECCSDGPCQALSRVRGPFRLDTTPCKPRFFPLL